MKGNIKVEDLVTNHLNNEDEEQKGQSQFSVISSSRYPSDKAVILAESLNNINLNFRASDPGRFNHEEISPDKFALRESSGEDMKNLQNSQL